MRLRPKFFWTWHNRGRRARRQFCNSVTSTLKTCKRIFGSFPRLFALVYRFTQVCVLLNALVSPGRNVERRIEIAKFAVEQLRPILLQRILFRRNEPSAFRSFMVAARSIATSPTRSVTADMKFHGVGWSGLLRCRLVPRIMRIA